MSDRVTIAHDYFGLRGGGERLVLVAAEALGARLVCGFRNAESYDATMFPHDTVDLHLPSMLQRPGLRAAALAIRFTAARSAFQDSSIRIFSGVAAPFAAETASGGRNVYYCHPPPRFLYDQRGYFAGSASRNPLRQIVLRQFQRGYEDSIGRMQAIIANSQTVRDRIRTYLGRDAEVIYPPCDLATFQWRGQQGFYLSMARLSGLKRVGKIVEAFIQMPDKQLVVASGGEELPMLSRLAADAPNITFLGWVSEEKLRELIGEAIATIYIPVDEDFGMSPVESMAAGKPVIGVAEGGLLETIVDGETGILLSPAVSAEAIVDAVIQMTPSKSAAMRQACVNRAELFSKERFIAGLRRVIFS